MPGNADAEAQKSCSDSHAAGGTTQDCPLKKIIELKWEQEETWCSETSAISGTTKKYPDGEVITIDVKDKADGSALTSLKGQVSSDGFGGSWKVIDVLPTGGPSWKNKREIDGVAGGVKTQKPLAMRFIPNVKRGKKAHTVLYDRTDPGAKAPHKVGVECHFELEAANYLLTIHGVLQYVRGHGRERLLLNAPALKGSFTAYGKQNHWGYLDLGTKNFKYWNGTDWKDVPATWKPDNSNHFGVAFYKSGGTWVCRDAPSESWPAPLSDWPANKYTGAGNATDTTLAKWKKNIDSRWTDQFDLKRKECKSAKVECCRYKTQCIAKFEEVAAYAAETIILVYEDVRSDSGMWAMGDTRDGLAPHEFGHLLGAPDEYGGVGTTQLGVNDGDGLSNGIDDDCLMGKQLSSVKKRHYKGVAEMLALLIADEFGKNYTYEAVAKDKNLASSSGSSPAPGASSGGSGSLVGAIIGGIVGAIAGAIIGFVASGGNPAGAAAGALAGAAAGALIGAGIGSLF